MNSDFTMNEALEIWITAELAEKIRAHGVETYPHECCGALLGCFHVAKGFPPGERAVIVTVFADSASKYLTERFWDEE